jgi:mRNA-degrading endonuclease RelE of RelBE toxin-antitoxin system
MYSLYLEKHFIARAKKLGKSAKSALDDNLKLLAKDPTHPHLRLKPLHGPLKGFYSIRVKELRVIIEFLKDKKIRVLEIERRDKVYKK